MSDVAAPSQWADAALAATLFAMDPVGLGGVAVRALPGPARDRWVSHLRTMLPPGSPVRRIPLHASDDRLLGGLDLSATLQAGRPIVDRGLLVEADGGVALLAMADCVTESTAARLSAVLDSGVVALERDGLAARTASRFGVVALDEGMSDDEHPPQSLLDRLAFHVDLTDVRLAQTSASTHTADDVATARLRLQRIVVSPAIIEALCVTALALGVESLRPPLFALRAARALCALDDRDEVSPQDAADAARLIFAPRATSLPAPPEADPGEGDEADSDSVPEPNTADSENDESDAAGDPTLSEVVLTAVRAAIPKHLLDQLSSGALGGAPRSVSGRSGAAQKSRLRGRPAGTTSGALRAGVRLNVIETLRAAAPWQRVRKRELKIDAGAARIQVRRDDFRITRFKQRTQTTTIFVVDASGSAALNRLAEAKGAVELLLAESYVRRDRVALISFRGTGAELLLPPTRSLVRAKRALSGLPGGGGTPLAAGIDAANILAHGLHARGDTPIIVVLTDGRANIARDGSSGRDTAVHDSLSAARQLRAAGFAAVLIDMAPRPQPTAEGLAAEMNARYLPLPHADATMLSRAVRSVSAAQ